MNSSIHNEEQFAIDAAKRLETISTNVKRVAVLHKELLEINVSVKAYIEESKKLLKAVQLDQAREAESSQQVAQILSGVYPKREDDSE